MLNFDSCHHSHLWLRSVDCGVGLGWAWEALLASWVLRPPQLLRPPASSERKSELAWERGPCLPCERKCAWGETYRQLLLPMGYRSEGPHPRPQLLRLRRCLPHPWRV